MTPQSDTMKIAPRDFDLFQPEQAVEKWLAKKTLPVRRLAIRFGNVAFLLAMICAMFFVSGTLFPEYQIAAFTSVCTLLAFSLTLDALSRKLLKLH
ncbi:hypothetical protein Q4494_04340 [Celeribacter halophilus]|uniref:YrhK-like protein n=1 Tax=Celeribacter halophilus TaxID=576117 RepID=A0AAW7XQX7_9RHOB|nr:hypothetical protein [Celeribacter halophilus]MDO6456297.1 hypothetical protein [Celeribacter halophilus]